MRTNKLTLIAFLFSVATPSLAQVIEETVVVADRVDTAADSLAVSVNVIDRDLIATLGSATLSQLLKTQVGISATQNGGIGAVSGIRIRGQDTFRTKVLLDGIDVSDPSSPQISSRMEHIASAALERVEVLRGTQGLLWGADAGGVISLTSRRGRDAFSLDLKAERGGYGFSTESLVATSGHSRFGEVSAVLNHVTLDGFNALRDDTALADRDGYDNDSYHVTYRTNVWNGWSASITTRQVDAETAYDRCGRFDEDFNFISSNDCSDGYTNRTQGVAISHSADRQQTRISWSESESDRAYFTDNQFQFALQGENTQFSATHNHRLTDALDVTVGADLDEQRYDDGFGTARRRGNDAAFINVRADLGEAMVSGALRSDQNDDFGRFNSWRVTALAETGLDGMLLKAVYGTGFRAPSPYEVGFNQSPFALPEARDTALKAEKSAGWEVGVRDQRTATTWELTYFDQRVIDTISYRYDPILGADGYIQTNGESQSRGVEASAAWDVTSTVALEGFITRLDTEGPSGTSLPYSPDVTAQLMARYSGTTSQGLVLARYTGDRVDEGNNSLKAYTVVDASYQLQVTDDITVSLRAENLSNVSYADVAGYRSPGRTLYVGLTVSLGDE